MSASSSPLSLVSSVFIYIIYVWYSISIGYSEDQLKKIQVQDTLSNSSGHIVLVHPLIKCDVDEKQRVSEVIIYVISGCGLIFNYTGYCVLSFGNTSTFSSIINPSGTSN